MVGYCYVFLIYITQLKLNKSPVCDIVELPGIVK